ncbi:MAG: hypothetical protein R3F59_15895 [Myxococcota bacterium]
MRVDSRTAILMTGYPVGTVVTVDTVIFDETIPLDLDVDGVGRVAAGAPLRFVGTVTEPHAAPVDTSFRTELPWDLVVTATEDTFRVDPWSDGYGGTFEVR